MKLVRRIHLYAGLFMAPWALMYGLSGFMFNHPSWFSFSQPGGERRFDLVVGTTTLANWPTADDLARKVVTALNANEAIATQGYTLTSEVPPKFAGAISLKSLVSVGSTTALILVNPDTRKGFLFLQPPGAADAQPLKIGVGFDDATVQSIQKEIITAAVKTDATVGSMRFGDIDIPQLAFHVHNQAGETCSVRYDSQTGEVTLQSVRPEPASLKAARFLMSLHMSRSYPDNDSDGSGFVGLRNLRAIFVDMMAAVMVFWALSGIAMWRQLKNLRSPGWLVILGAAIIAASLWLGMYRYFASLQ